MSSANDSNGTPSEASFEHSLAELETIVHELEDGHLGLAEALARYEQGVKHLKHCYALLTQAEQKIELLTRVSAAGEAVTEPFVEGDAAADKPAARRKGRVKPQTAAPEEPWSLDRDVDG